MDTFEAMGYSVEPLGGGRIVRKDAPVNTVEIYGYSVGFGGGQEGRLVVVWTITARRPRS